MECDLLTKTEFLPRRGQFAFAANYRASLFGSQRNLFGSIHAPLCGILLRSLGVGCYALADARASAFISGGIWIDEGVDGGG